MRVLVLCALAACSYPEKEYAFSCVGAPPPTTAPNVVKLLGMTIDAGSSMPVPGVMVTLEMNTVGVAAPVTTNETGSFSFSQMTGNAPVDGLDLHAQIAGFAETYFYPPHPVSADFTANLALVSTVQQGALAMGFGIALDPGSGQALLTINDCAGLPLSGAMVTSSSGSVHYFSGVSPDPMANATDATAVVLVANMAPGPVTLTATVDGHTLPARDFTVVAGKWVETLIQP
jgi:hypothetical protein